MAFRSQQMRTCNMKGIKKVARVSSIRLKTYSIKTPEIEKRVNPIEIPISENIHTNSTHPGTSPYIPIPPPHNPKRAPTPPKHPPQILRQPLRPLMRGEMPPIPMHPLKHHRPQRPPPRPRRHAQILRKITNPEFHIRDPAA